MRIKNRLKADKMIVVDLYSGRYSKEHEGHEFFNLNKNPLDGNYYGYCPPWDGISITKLGAHKKDEYVDGILVIYTTKKKNSSNREIIAFTLNARVYKKGQSGERLNRYVKEGEEEKICTYSVESDNLYNLQNRFNKFEIKINDYNTYMFRKQRFYGGKYPMLDKKIIGYIESILDNSELLDNDDCDEQKEIQRVEAASLEDIQNSAKKPLCIVSGNQGKVIAKDNRISKSALIDANFTCIINPSHKTFITKNHTPYMEGHHLIPCTVTNSEYFMKKFNKNIDCFENIVCICPNCHREVHYGEWGSKSEKIKMMLNKQQEKLKRIGLSITEAELLSLYKK